MAPTAGEMLGDFYSDEGEVLATRGEIHIDELTCACRRKRCACLENAGGISSYSDPILCKTCRKPVLKIYCGQGNPILFNATSDITRKEVSPTTKFQGFPWAMMENCSSYSPKGEARRFLSNGPTGRTNRDYVIMSTVATVLNCRSPNHKPMHVQ
jgi:hypothetical protein